MRDDHASPDPEAMRRRLLRYRVGALVALLAGAAGTIYLAAAQDRCSGGGAGGLVVHDARGQPRLAIGLVGRCQPRPPDPPDGARGSAASVPPMPRRSASLEV